MTGPNEPQRVAVTVFVEVTGDDIDAETIAQVTVRHALTNAGAGGLLACPLRQPAGVPTPSVRVVKVMETGTAAAGGYLRTSVTPKAFRERS